MLKVLKSQDDGKGIVETLMEEMERQLEEINQVEEQGRATKVSK